MSAERLEKPEASSEIEDSPISSERKMSEWRYCGDRMGEAD
jgi:hypothetical protein